MNDGGRRTRQFALASRNHGLWALVPVERVPLHEQVYVQLSAVFRRGELRAGETLSLRCLAALLGVSPMPVCDAVGRLANEGVLEVTLNRQVRVPLPTAAQYHALTEARIAAEGHAGFLAARRITRNELDELLANNRYLIQAAKRRDHTTIMNANQDVHFTVYRAARSSKLLQVIESPWKQGGPYLAAIDVGVATSETLSGHDFGAEQHTKIHAALSEHNPQLARQLIGADIKQFGQIFLHLIADSVAHT